MSGYDAYVGGGDDLTGSTSRPFDNDGYIGYDPRLPSQRFESSFRSPDRFTDDQFPPDEPKDAEEFENGNGFEGIGGNEAPIYVNNSEDEAPPQQPDTPPMFSQGFDSAHQVDFGGDYSPPSELNGKGFDVNGLYGMPQLGSDGPILPSPEEMQPEEGFLLREWRRQNAIRLEEKERGEKERLHEIMDEAEAFREEFYNKRKIHCETNKKNNREKEKVYLANQEKFHANADKQYWKAVAELIPHELPSIETKRGGKDKDKRKPTIVVNQGPKPGKPTDLSRMRQILIKLKHNPPPHMKAPPPPPPPAAANGSAPASSTGTAPASSTGAASAPNSSTGAAPTTTSSTAPAHPVAAA
eukprot:Gb_32674 [translate_table: standard]